MASGERGGSRRHESSKGVASPFALEFESGQDERVKGERERMEAGPLENQ